MSSSTNPSRRLVTSALPYANGPLHLGHLAGAYLPADVYVRYLRSSGQDVLWICGSDEHGAAISMRAKREGRSEQSIIDTYHTLNKDAFARFGVSFDMYDRTSSKLHHETAQDLFRKLVAKGDQFEVRTSEQYYDAEFKSFLADRFIQGTCPNCGSEKAFGDQCENCGKDLSPTELISPRSTLSGAVPTLKTTSHWYFRLDAHEAWLKDYIAKGELDGKKHHNPKEWRNHVLGQCESWLKAGLQPRAFTRDLDWGIEVPQELEGAEGKVLYVWFDAPIGYISATKQWAIDQGTPDAWEPYWKDADTDLIHFIGKDNIVFHCLTFQATLKALGDYNIAHNVPANQFLNFEGQKFSKSRGIGITMDEYLETFKDFPNHVDAMRYALVRNAPENKDADFTWDDFTNFHDKELADKLGNFINRTVVLTHKYFDGIVQASSLGEDVSKHLSAVLTEVSQLIESYHFKEALSKCMAFMDYANTDLQERAPWKLYKEDPESPAIAEALFIATQCAALARVIFEPFIPNTSAKLSKLFHVQDLSFEKVKALLEQGKPLLDAGAKLGEPELLFAKIHDRKDDSRLQLIDAQKASAAAAIAAVLAAEKPKFAPVKETIQFDDFTKLDIRTGTIIEAEKIPKADKLLKIQVDLGFEKRTIVSGIAQHFEPENLEGTQVLVLVNLAPRKLRGVESAGMILMAEDAEGKLQFVAPSSEFPAGMTVA